MGRDCLFTFYNGSCMWLCKCEESCYKCIKEFEEDWYDRGYMLEPVREKYVCLDCHHIFKTKFTKYYIENLYELPTSNPQKKELKSIKKYEGARCSICSKDALEVGPDFRHCKSDKKWYELKKKIENKEIDLKREFSYCPTNYRHML